MRINHKAIYQALYIQVRGALRRDLTTACDTETTSGHGLAAHRKPVRAWAAARATNPLQPKANPARG